MFIVYQPLLLSAATKYHIEDSNHVRKKNRDWLTRRKKIFSSFVAFSADSDKCVELKRRREQSLELMYSWLKFFHFNSSQHDFMASFLFYLFFDWLSSIHGIWRKKLKWRRNARDETQKRFIPAAFDCCRIIDLSLPFDTVEKTRFNSIVTIIYDNICNMKSKS